VGKLTRDILAAGALSALAIGSAADAAAQQVMCRDRAEVVEMLSSRFDEAPRFMGMNARGQVLEVWLAPDGSWTAVVSTPGGRSCIVAAGFGGDLLPPRPTGDPA